MSTTVPVAKKTRLLARLSVRAQVLIFAALFLAAVGIWTAVSRNKPSPTPPSPTPPATATPPDSTPTKAAPAVTLAPLPAGTFSTQQRLPQPTPSADEQQAMNNQKATPIEPRADQNVRDVGTPIAAAVPKKPGSDDDSDEAAAATKRAAGAPYSAKQAKGTVPEIFGMMGPPPPAPAPREQVGAAQVQPASAAATLPAPPQRFAPFGRLVKCVLVNTIDSLTPSNTPIIALTVEETAWNHETIIPVNTEVFSYVNSEPKMDARGVGRLYDNGEWLLVLPRQPGEKNGREWQVRGRALDRREQVVELQGRVRSWGIDDMAPGFIGYTVNTLDQEEIKLFIASFFGAASKALGETLQDREAIPGMAGAFGGTQPAATARNAAINATGQGAGAVLDAAAERINEEIKRRGFYVRVPAKHEFYLFIEQTLDPREARVGLRLPAPAAPAPNQNAGQEHKK